MDGGLERLVDDRREREAVVGGDVLGDAASPLGGAVPLGVGAPTYQNTEGTAHSVPKDPKSSLAEKGGPAR
jgi:hypothetical protein